MISIVITSFNRKYIIQRAIDSAILFCKSLEVDFELIIVDDNSSDNTKEFIYSNYPKEIESELIKYYYLKKNLGVTGAKNYGFFKAKYQWVIFLDSDDEMYVPLSQYFYQSLFKYDEYPILFFRCIDQNKDFVGEKFDNDKILDFKEYLNYSSYGEALTLINKKIVLKRPYYTKLRGYEGLGCLDIIYKYKKAILVNVVARVYYRDNNDRLSSFRNFIKRGNLLASGHLLLLKKYSCFLPIKRKVKLIVLSIVYFILNKLLKK